MKTTQLIVGEFYRHIGKPPHNLIICERPVKYCGTREYRGRINHEFWDYGMSLNHWLDADEVERVAGYKPPR